MRGCLDLRTINPFLKYEHLKMEGVHTLQSTVRRRDWLTKLDLSDFFMPVSYTHLTLPTILLV